MSLFVITISNALSWDKCEEKAYEMIMSLEEKELLKMQSIGVFTSSYQFRKSLKNSKSTKLGILRKFYKYRENILKFRDTVKRVRGNFTYTTMDGIHNDIVDMGEEVDDIKKCTLRLKEKF